MGGGLVKCLFPTPNYGFWAKMVILTGSMVTQTRIFYNMLGSSFIYVYFIEVKRGGGTLWIVCVYKWIIRGVGIHFKREMGIGYCNTCLNNQVAQIATPSNYLHPVIVNLVFSEIAGTELVNLTFQTAIGKVLFITLYYFINNLVPHFGLSTSYFPYATSTVLFLF